MAEKELLSDIDIDLKGLERFRWNFILDKKFRSACEKKYVDPLSCVMNGKKEMDEEIKKEYYRFLYKLYDFDRVQSEN